MLIDVHRRGRVGLSLYRFVCNRAGALDRRRLRRSGTILEAQRFSAPRRLPHDPVHGGRVFQPALGAARPGCRLEAENICVAAALAEGRPGAANTAQLDADGAGAGGRGAGPAGGALSERAVAGFYLALAGSANEKLNVDVTSASPVCDSILRPLWHGKDRSSWIAMLACCRQ